MNPIPSLRKRILCYFLLVGLLPLLGGSVAALLLLWRHTVEDVEARHLTLAESLAFQIRETLKAHELALAHMAGMFREVEDEPFKQDSLLMHHAQTLAAQGISIEAWATLEKDGKLRAAFPKDAEISRLNLLLRPEVQKALHTGQQAYSGVQIPLGFSEPMVSVALPLGPTTLLGFIPVASLNKKIQRLALPTAQIKLLLTDETGVLISHEDPLLVAQRFNVLDLPPIRGALSGNENKIRYSRNGTTWLGASARVPELGWAVAVIEPEFTATAFLRDTIWTLLVAFSAAVVLAAILAMLLGTGFLDPLMALSAVLARISQGEYGEKLGSPAFQELEGFHLAFEKMVSDLKKRESELTEAALAWQRTFDAVPDPIWLLDQGHRIQRANRAACVFLGMEEEELLGRQCFRLVHKTESPPANCPHALTMKNGQTHSAEQIVDKKTLLVTTAPIKDDSGELLGSVHLAKDITERKKMEEALRQSEERYRLVVENAQDAILVAQEGFIKFLNPRTLELTGFSEEELTKRPFWEFIFSEDRPLVTERYRQRLQREKGLPESYRFRVMRSTGEIRWVEIRALPILWEERPATLSFLSDITEKLQNEEALKQSEERYRSLVENSPDGIFMAEIPSGKITFVNKEICRMFGYAPQEALELDFWRALPHEEIPRIRDMLGDVLEGAALPKAPISITALRKDASMISIEVRVAFVHYQGRQVLQAIVRDVTEQQLLQKQLQHSQRMQALGTLAGGVAHEFNNLLASIQGFAELLQFTIRKDQEGFEYIREIISSCERAGSLTSKMLSLARVEVGEKYPVKVNQVIEGSQRLLSQTLPPTIGVEMNLASGLPFVMADPTQLEQVLLNLALNARDAMPHGGTIFFTSRLSLADPDLRIRCPYIPPGRFVEISVKDQGTGIPREHLERIFEPFFTTKEAGKGTGLGLSVSYSIIKAHNGFIFAQSPAPGESKGSLFRILLPPAEISQEYLQRAKGKTLPPPGGKGERILVADDETRIREILKKALETHGYRVETAPDGEKAAWDYLQAMQKGEPFQAVILDLAMPVRDGKWAMSRILESHPDARIIVATGYTDEEFLEQESKQKAMAILRKPFDISILLRTLGDCLEGVKGK